MIRRLLTFSQSSRRKRARKEKTNQENPFVRRHHLRDLQFALGSSVGKGHEVLSRCHSEACKQKHLK